MTNEQQAFTYTCSYYIMNYFSFIMMLFYWLRFKVARQGLNTHTRTHAHTHTHTNRLVAADRSTWLTDCAVVAHVGTKSPKNQLTPAGNDFEEYPTVSVAAGKSFRRDLILTACSLIDTCSGMHRQQAQAGGNRWRTFASLTFPPSLPPNITIADICPHTHNTNPEP